MATVGGMASTNAHGMRAVKYGPTSAWVLGLQVVLPDGEVIETGSVGSRAKQSSAGLELTKLIVGAEGTLGVVTRLRLKLMAIPTARAIVLGPVRRARSRPARPSRPSSARASARRRSRSSTSAAFRPSTCTARRWRCQPVEAMILFEVDGNPPGVRWDAERICEVIAPFARRSRVVGRAGAHQRAVGGALGGRRGGRHAAARLEPRLLRRGHLRARRAASPRRCARFRTSAPATASRSPPTATSAAAGCIPAT